MKTLTLNDKTTGRHAWSAVSSEGKLARNGSTGPAAGGNGAGTGPDALMEDAIADTEASLTQKTERRLGEVPLPYGE
ncbi:MAG: hypothetical protein ACYS15_09610 [Planctomycetota bacterium]|jgi:hypothetical protein